MKVTGKYLCLAPLFLGGLLSGAEAPLAKPLAEFDRLVSQLTIANVVGQPVRIGDNAVIPFAKVQFGVGSGGAMAGFGGGMGAKTIPLGVLIVEGDEVRAELFPEQEEKTSTFQQLLQAVLDRKVVFMVNGLNIGNAPGDVQDLAPLISEMMGQTTFMVQALNLGNLSRPGAASARNTSLDGLTKLFQARKYVDALAVADALMAKDSKNADVHAWRGRILSSLAQANPADMLHHGIDARGEFEKALSLDPRNRTALLGRGIGRLMAPPGYGGDIDGAIADLQAALVQESSAATYFYLGDALRAKGLKSKATAAYRKALELQPNDPDVLKALAALK